jgi:hypothetical protein
MAYLLTNAARARASQNHADHHVWGMTREQYIERMKYNKTADGVRAYERVLRDPSSIDHKFDPNCEQCEIKRNQLEESRRREAEEAEKYRIRQEEEKAKKKEKEREANERRMMAAEDKPRTPPPKKNADPKEMDEWRRLQEEEKALLEQVARVRAKAERLNPSKATTDNTFKCTLCNASYCSSNGGLDNNKRKLHLATRKHQINAGLVAKDTYPRHCDTCDYDAKTKHAWEQHCEGKKHLARSTQTITIPTTQEVEKEQGVEERPSAISPEDIVESS